jgi:hypothetical protein
MEGETLDEQHPTKETIPMSKGNQEKIEAPVWLKDCDICNVGLCKAMDHLTQVSKMSMRKAAQKLASEATETIGTQVYSTDAILGRYRLHKGFREPHPPKKKDPKKPGQTKRIDPQTGEEIPITKAANINTIKDLKQWGSTIDKYVDQLLQRLHRDHELLGLARGQLQRVKNQILLVELTDQIDKLGLLGKAVKTEARQHIENGN